MKMTTSAKKHTAVILEALAAATLIYWVLTSGSIWTMTKVPVEVKDELFGTTSIEWRDGFKLGLEYAGSIALVFIAIAYCFWRSAKKTKNPGNFASIR